MEIKHGSLEWAVDFLKDCVANRAKIEVADKKTQDACNKIGITSFYDYHIEVLTEEICNGVYKSHKED